MACDEHPARSAAPGPPKGGGGPPPPGFFGPPPPGDFFFLPRSAGGGWQARAGLDLPARRACRRGWRPGSPAGLAQAGACGPAGTGRTCGPQGPAERGSTSKGSVPLPSRSANRKRRQQGADAYIVQERGRHALRLGCSAGHLGSMQARSRALQALREQLAPAGTTGPAGVGVVAPAGAAGPAGNPVACRECLEPLAALAAAARLGLVGTMAPPLAQIAGSIPW